MENFNLKKFFLYLLICSIALSALMGIWAILSGEFGDLQARVLGTTMTVVGTSILGLACGAFFESPRSRGNALFILPLAGIILAVLSALIILWVIWSPSSWEGEILYKTLSTSLIFAFSLAQLSLLSMARLAKRFRWAIITAYVVVLALASIISLLIVVDTHSDNDFITRALGVLGVIDASVTVMIPILHRLSRTEFVETEAPSVGKIDAEIDKLRSQIAHLEKQKEDILAAEEKA